MRILAKVFFHLLNWLRAPLFVALYFARFFSYVLLALAVVLLLVLPRLRHVEIELLVMTLVGSFGCYLLVHFYDRALYRLNVEASR
jgi:hypothetical protein